MGASPVPIEWMEGRSRAPHFIVHFLIAGLSTWVAGTVVTVSLFGPISAQDVFWGILLRAAASGAFVLPFVALLSVLWPTPPVRIGLLPTGLILDWGVRKQNFKWQEVSSRQNRLYVRTTRWFPPVRVAVSSYQLERIRHFIGNTPLA